MLLDIGQKACPNPLYINSQRNHHTMAESRGEGEKTGQDCWTLMTRAEKVLLFLLILALLALVGLSTFIIIHFLERKDCDTHECIKASYELLNTVDFSVDPCEDVHSFICGNYIPIYNERKVDIVTDDIHEDDTYSLQTLKKFYQACTNTTAIEDDNEQTLSTLISQIGGWPLLIGGHWNEENFNWQRFMADVRPWGVKYDWLLRFDYYEDEDSGTNFLMISPPNLETTSYEFKTRYYTEIIIELAKKLGTPFVQEHLNQMIQFEDDLSSIVEKAQQKPGNSTKFTVAKLNELWSQNILFEILNDLGRGYAVFTNNTVVVISSELYIYDLHRLLGSESKRVQANYFVWKIIQIYLPFTSDAIRDVYDKYHKVGSREEHCHAETIRRFHSVIEDEYVEKYKSENSLTLLQTIINLIYQSFNESEDVANLVIDGPEGKHSGVTSIDFKSHKIVRMISDVEFHIENEFYKCLHKKYDTCVKEGYYEDTEKLSAYFDHSDQSFHLPYYLVYSDFFMWDRPNYINFAKIGRIVGNTLIASEEERCNTTLKEVGVDLAYEGYTKWLSTHGLEQDLPALNYSMKQLFWMFSSTTYCASNNSNMEKFEEVQNSQYFEEDFSCS